jgi:hypothetical protein
MLQWQGAIERARNTAAIEQVAQESQASRICPSSPCVMYWLLPLTEAMERNPPELLLKNRAKLGRFRAESTVLQNGLHVRHSKGTVSRFPSAIWTVDVVRSPLDLSEISRKHAGHPDRFCQIRHLKVPPLRVST